jgi:hypothetical protein
MSETHSNFANFKTFSEAEYKEFQKLKTIGADTTANHGPRVCDTLIQMIVTMTKSLDDANDLWKIRENVTKLIMNCDIDTMKVILNNRDLQANYLFNFDQLLHGTDNREICEAIIDAVRNSIHPHVLFECDFEDELDWKQQLVKNLEAELEKQGSIK